MPKTDTHRTLSGHLRILHVYLTSLKTAHRHTQEIQVDLEEYLKKVHQDFKDLSQRVETCISDMRISIQDAEVELELLRHGIVSEEDRTKISQGVIDDKP